MLQRQTNKERNPKYNEHSEFCKAVVAEHVDVYPTGLKSKGDLLCFNINQVDLKEPDCDFQDQTDMLFKNITPASAAGRPLFLFPTITHRKSDFNLRHPGYRRTRTGISLIPYCSYAIKQEHYKI